MHIHTDESPRTLITSNADASPEILTYHRVNGIIFIEKQRDSARASAHLAADTMKRSGAVMS
jgi:hypothetical protein